MIKHRRSVWTEPEYGTGGRCSDLGELIELPSQRASSDVKMLNPQGYGAQGEFGHLDRLGEVGQVGLTLTAVAVIGIVPRT